MAKKQAEAYFWRGKAGRGELEIDGDLYIVGKKIPHDKMNAATFKKMVDDGRIQKTAFDIVESTTEVSELKDKIKDLSAELVKRNKQEDLDAKPYTDKIAELETELAGANDKVEELEEAATGENPLQAELDTANEKVATLEAAAKVKQS